MTVRAAGAEADVGDDGPLVELSLTKPKPRFVSVETGGFFFETIAFLIYAVRRAAWALRRRRQSRWSVTFFGDRVEVQVSESEGSWRSAEVVGFDNAGLVLVGERSLRVAGTDWAISEADSTRLLLALRGTRWQRRLSTSRRERW